jgi:DNA-binding LytR/AlgR family response regulator
MPPSSPLIAPLRCLVVDDEAPAHAILKNYISQIAALEFVAAAFNAIEATNLLHCEKIDLLFLDINMPRMTGLDMLQSLSRPPKVILTTAYSEFALESYEHGVVDYLLKPIAFPRFLKAVNRIVESVPQEIAESIAALPEEYNPFFWVKTDKGHFRIAFSELIFVQSIGNYVRLTLRSGETHLVLQTAKDLENLLPDRFVRIHKTFLINLDFLTRVEGGRVFLDKTELPIGAMFRKDFLRKLGR